MELTRAESGRNPVQSTCPAHPGSLGLSVIVGSLVSSDGFGTELGPEGSLFLKRDLQGQRVALQRGALNCAPSS